jgi:hypothetical protein
MTPPDWLKLHDGDIKPGKDGHSLSVFFAGALQYVLVPVPARGTFACRISETINGRRVESDKVYPTAEAAFAGGLDDLRAHLGW